MCSVCFTAPLRVSLTNRAECLQVLDEMRVNEDRQATLFFTVFASVHGKPNPTDFTV